MSVHLQPADALGFHRPLTQLVKRTLTVTNTNAHAVAFKVKTTAPKQYCVRPNSGRIEAGERVEVQVLLQPMKEDPPASFRCRDKFLVQSVPITAERESLSLGDLWSTVEKEDKSNIHEAKIRCTYLPPVDAQGGEAGPPPVSHSPQASLTNGFDSHGDSSFATVRGAPSEFVNAPSPKTNGIANRDSSLGSPSSPLAADAAPAPPSSEPSVAKEAAVAGGAAVAGLGAAVAATSAGAPESKIKAVPSEAGTTGANDSTSNAALQAKLKAAEAEVSRLQAQLGSDGVRKRNVKADDAAAPSSAIKVDTGAHQTGASVPINVVAGLMLASFIMGIILF